MEMKQNQTFFHGTYSNLAQASGTGGEQKGRLPPTALPPQSFLTMCPFFEKPFKCAFIENIKSEIVNIQ